MKPLSSSGGLVDFKEKLIFEEYKETVIKTSADFKKEVKEKYNFVASSNLYAKIVNYQIEKYGATLNYSSITARDFDRNFHNKTPKKQRGCKERWKKYDDEVKFLEKMEKRNVSK